MSIESCFGELESIMLKLHLRDPVNGIKDAVQRFRNKESCGLLARSISSRSNY